jgi:hypothetical protein
MFRPEIRSAMTSACRHAAPLASAQAPLSGNIQKSMMPVVSNKFSELRITRAYLRLLCIPENASGARMVLLERIGDYEIRMFEAVQTDSADGPLFWMELFDCDGQSSVDSCCCYEIEQAATAFNGFVSQAKHPGEGLPQAWEQSQN